MTQKTVRKHMKGEIYSFIDSTDKNNISQDQSLLVGSRPIMVVKGGENTSLVVPFTSSPYKKPIAVIHSNGVKSYPAYNMMKTVNNKDLSRYLSTISDPSPILKLISEYINDDSLDISEEAEETVLSASVFIPGQIWKRKEGPYFLILKVLGDTSKNSFLMTGIVLDQVDENEEDYDIIIPCYKRKFHIDLFKTITITSDDIDYYQGQIDKSLLTIIRNNYADLIIGDEYNNMININQIDNMLGKTTEYNPLENRYSPNTVKEELDIEESIIVKQNDTTTRTRKIYTEEEKEFIVTNTLDAIMNKFDLTYIQSYKLKYYMRKTYLAEKTISESPAKASSWEAVIQKNNSYSQEEILFIKESSIGDIGKKFSLDFKKANALKKQYC